jgi:hypothetical protein
MISLKRKNKSSTVHATKHHAIKVKRKNGTLYTFTTKAYNFYCEWSVFQGTLREDRHMFSATIAGFSCKFLSGTLYTFAENNVCLVVTVYN